MLRLGLRASEVAALRLDDLDWRAGQVTVHGKGGRVDQLPLPVDVGEAITAYLRRGRPRTASREVFVRVVRRRLALTRTGVTNIVLMPRAAPGSARSVRTGCGTPPPATCCAPALRWPRSGRCCGTARPARTAAYARVDVERLRMIARPWPIGATS